MSIFDNKPSPYPQDFGNVAIAPTLSTLEALEQSYELSRMVEQFASEDYAEKTYWEPKFEQVEAALREKGVTDEVDLFIPPWDITEFGGSHLIFGDNPHQRYVGMVDRYNAVIDKYGLDIGIFSAEEHNRRTLDMARKVKEEAESRPTNTGIFGDLAWLAGMVGADIRYMFQDPAYAAINILGPVKAAAAVKAGWSWAQKAAFWGLTEGIVNAGAEVYHQPNVAAWRKKLGYDYTFEDFSTRVGAAFGFGVLIGSGGQVVSSGINRALTGRQIREGMDAVEKAGGKINPDARKYANLAEGEETIERQNPLAGGADGEIEHIMRALETEVAAAQSRPANISETPNAPVKRETDIFINDKADANVVSVLPDDVEVDAQLFQFKRGGDDAGVTERLRDVDDWNPEWSGQVIIYERTDGRRVIVDGHQRLGLAKRIKEKNPDADIRLYARVLREADGITVDAARLRGALKNIAEGSGDPVDAAKVLRIDPDSLTNLPPRSGLVRTARGMMKLDDEAFDLVEQGFLDPAMASLVGRYVDDPARQIAIMRLLKDVEPDNLVEAEAVIRQALNTPFDTKTQVNLFGEEVITSSLFKERAKVLNQALKELKKDRATFKNLVDNASDIEAGGNRLAKTQNNERAMTDGEAIQTIQKTANRKGQLSDALNAAAQKFKETGNLSGAARDVVRAVREGVERGDFRRMDDGGAGRNLDGTEAPDIVKDAPGQRELDKFDDPYTGPGVKEQGDQLEAVADTTTNINEKEIPIGEIVGDQGELIPDLKSKKEIFDDIKSDEKYLARLKDCV
tara:strand:+ start:4741 stop:7128 length:2388 start_codon:yes stop_codon:yes gene_type:complete